MSVVIEALCSYQDNVKARSQKKKREQEFEAVNV